MLFSGFNSKTIHEKSNNILEIYQKNMQQLAQVYTIKTITVL